MKMYADTVSLLAAQALKAAGMPQDSFPQHVWIRYMLASPTNTVVFGRYIGGNVWAQSDWTCHFYFDLLDPAPDDFEWVAAPSHLRALTWLEEQGCQWSYAFGDWLGRYPGWIEDWRKGRVEHEFYAEDADGIIVQLCEWLIEAAAVRKEAHDAT